MQNHIYYADKPVVFKIETINFKTDDHLNCSLFVVRCSFFSDHLALICNSISISTAGSGLQ